MKQPKIQQNSLIFGNIFDVTMFLTTLATTKYLWNSYVKIWLAKRLPKKFRTLYKYIYTYRYTSFELFDVNLSLMIHIVYDMLVIRQNRMSLPIGFIYDKMCCVCVVSHLRWTVHSYTAGPEGTLHTGRRRWRWLARIASTFLGNGRAHQRRRRRHGVAWNG